MRTIPQSCRSPFTITADHESKRSSNRKKKARLRKISNKYKIEKWENTTVIWGPVESKSDHVTYFLSRQGE